LQDGILVYDCDRHRCDVINFIRVKEWWAIFLCEFNRLPIFRIWYLQISVTVLLWNDLSSHAKPTSIYVEDFTWWTTWCLDSDWLLENMNEFAQWSSGVGEGVFIDSHLEEYNFSCSLHLTHGFFFLYSFRF